MLGVKYQDKTTKNGGSNLAFSLDENESILSIRTNIAGLPTRHFIANGVCFAEKCSAAGEVNVDPNYKGPCTNTNGNSIGS